MTEQHPQGVDGTPTDDDQKKKKERRGAFWWFGQYDRWSGRYDWLTWLFSGGKAATATAIVATGAVATAGVVAYNAYLADPPAPAEKPGLVAVAPQRFSESTIVFPIEGRDAAGRRGKFDVIVLTKNFGWVRKSTDQLQRDSDVLAGPDVAKQVFNDEIQSSLSKAVAVIAAGVASQEGDPATETERAGQRAKKSAEWIAPVVQQAVPLWTLNLGQYKQPCAECATSGTDWQRPFIIVAVRELDPETDMGQALADGLRGKSNLPSPEAYSAYQLAKFR